MLSRAYRPVIIIIIKGLCPWGLDKPLILYNVVSCKHLCSFYFLQGSSWLSCSWYSGSRKHSSSGEWLTNLSVFSVCCCYIPHHIYDLNTVMCSWYHSLHFSYSYEHPFEVVITVAVFVTKTPQCGNIVCRRVMSYFE